MNKIGSNWFMIPSVTKMNKKQNDNTKKDNKQNDLNDHLVYLGAILKFLIW
jgi:hypothetical protein